LLLFFSLRIKELSPIVNSRKKQQFKGKGKKKAKTEKITLSDEFAADSEVVGRSLYEEEQEGVIENSDE